MLIHNTIQYGKKNRSYHSVYLNLLYDFDLTKRGIQTMETNIKLILKSLQYPLFVIFAILFSIL